VTVLGVVILLLITMFFLELDRARGAAVIDLNPLFRVAFGLWYVPLAISHFIWFHHSFAGVLWVFFILVLAFSGDTAAYYVGRTWGRKKLMPALVLENGGGNGWRWLCLVPSVVASMVVVLPPISPLSFPHPGGDG